MFGSTGPLGKNSDRAYERVTKITWTNERENLSNLSYCGKYSLCDTIVGVYVG